MSISKDKKAILHIAKQKLGLDDESYKEILYNCSNGSATSSTQLSDADFHEVMKVFNHLGFNDGGLKMTKAQYKRIKHEEQRLGWACMPRRLAGFAKRTCGDENWRQFGVKRASQLITGLERL